MLVNSLLNATQYILSVANPPNWGLLTGSISNPVVRQLLANTTPPIHDSYMLRQQYRVAAPDTELSTTHQSACQSRLILCLLETLCAVLVPRAYLPTYVYVCTVYAYRKNINKQQNKKAQCKQINKVGTALRLHVPLTAELYPRSRALHSPMTVLDSKYVRPSDGEEKTTNPSASPAPCMSGRQAAREPEAVKQTPKSKKNSTTYCKTCKEKKNATGRYCLTPPQGRIISSDPQRAPQLNPTQPISPVEPSFGSKHGEKLATFAHIANNLKVASSRLALLAKSAARVYAMS